MSAIGILIVLASLPAFIMLLGMGAQYRRYAFIALGALPILSSGLNIDAAFFNLAGWPGHTKGVVLSMVDTLSIAIILHYAKVQSSRVFLAVWIAYIALHVPGMIVSDYTMASFAYWFKLIRGALFFSACYAVMRQGGLQPLILGLALSVIANGFSTIQNSLTGSIQAGGLVGHRNYAGLMNNLAVPVLLVAVLTWKKARIPALALGFAAIAAVLGGSRAAAILFAGSVGLTLMAAMVIKPSKRLTMMTSLAAVAAVVMVPAFLYKMGERFERSGEAFNLEQDEERIAFERASALMNADYPMGVGLNQYAVKSNAGGYASRAGVGWATVGRVALVHNSYILIRTEGGYSALFGVYILFGSMMLIAAQLALKKRNNPGRMYAVATGIATAILALHLNYEWSIAMMNAIYALGFSTALLGFALSESKRAATPEKRPVNRRVRQRRAQAGSGVTQASEGPHI